MPLQFLLRATISSLLLITFTTDTHSTNLRLSPNDPWHGNSGSTKLQQLSKSLETESSAADALKQSSAIAYLINQQAKQSACDNSNDGCKQYKHFMHKIKKNKEYSIRSFSGNVYLDNRYLSSSSPSSHEMPLIVAEDQMVQKWEKPPSNVHHVFRLTSFGSTSKINDKNDEDDDDDDDDYDDDNDDQNGPKKWCIQSVVQSTTVASFYSSDDSTVAPRWYCHPKTGILELHDEKCTPFIIAPIEKTGLYTIQEDPDSTQNALESASFVVGEIEIRGGKGGREGERVERELSCHSPNSGIFMKQHFDVTKFDLPPTSQRFMLQPYVRLSSSDLDFSDANDSLNKLKNAKTINDKKKFAKDALNAFNHLSNEEEEVSNNNGDSGRLKKTAYMLSRMAKDGQNGDAILSSADAELSRALDDDRNNGQPSETTVLKGDIADALSRVDDDRFIRRFR